MRRALAVALFLGACHEARPATVLPSPAAPVTHYDVDAKVDPCTDFYDYACGPWRASHPIPADRAKWSRYSEVDALNRVHERAILEAPGTSAGERRIGNYYAACMNEPELEARKLARFDAFVSQHESDFTQALAAFHLAEIGAVFALFVEPDLRDASKMIATFGTAALGLPDPDDYLGADSKSRDQYRAHLERVLELLGRPEPAATAERVLAFELALAKTALKGAARRDMEKKYHPMTLAELTTRFPSVKWVEYARAVGLGEMPRVNVVNPEMLEAALTYPDAGARNEYLRVTAARRLALTLPPSAGDELFRFRELTLRGAKVLSPRAQRCQSLTDADLGDDVGRVFLERHFPAETRERAKVMVDRVIASFRADIQASEWLTPAARAAALSKLDRHLTVLGGTNRPTSFEGLVVDPHDALGNLVNARKIVMRTELGKLARPADREYFFNANPQDFDGFGNKLANATGFTAGYLQPPIFDPKADEATNFGGFGAVIGHELTHGFDDEGRKYDADGNHRTWWSPEDVASFETRAQCITDEYAAFRAEDGTPLDGRLELGENVADNGGIRLSWNALQPSFAAPAAGGFSPAQRFFLGWAAIRCENLTPETAKRLAQHDEHAPGRWRVNGVVANLPEFARAFSCPATAPLAPAKRCRVW